MSGQAALDPSEKSDARSQRADFLSDFGLHVSIVRSMTEGTTFLPAPRLLEVFSSGTYCDI